MITNKWSLNVEVQRNFDSSTGKELEPRTNTWVMSDEGKYIAIVSRDYTSPGQTKKNAALIACAPELLALLEEFDETSQGDSSDFMLRVRAVLYRATAQS